MTHLARLRLALAVSLLPLALPAQVSFRTNYLDTSYGGNGKPGWVQAGDMDGDGDLDVVAGGGEALFVYENRGGGNSWLRHGNLDGSKLIGANAGVLHDIDEDGDLDVLSGKYAREIGWWENPGGALRTTNWAFHRVHPGLTAWYLHDMVKLDIDGDGKANEVVFNLHLNTYWNAPVQIYWMRISKTPGDWQTHTIQPQRPGPNHCHAGFGVADIDGDGHVDLAYSDGWYQAPADPTQAWTWRRLVTNIYGVSNSQAGDMNGDGKVDLVVSAGHHGQGVHWLEAVDPANDQWIQRTIDPSVVHPEGLQIHDLDGDGDLDVVACELFFGTNGQPRWDEQKHNLYFYENVGGATPTWRKVNIAPDTYPSHLPHLFDINGDGRLDLISEATGAPIVTYFENTSSTQPLRLGRVAPNSFVSVLGDKVRIEGAGLDQVHTIRIDSRNVTSTDPADWLDGYFDLQSATQIDFYPPHDMAPGGYKISVQSSTTTSARVSFYIVRPTSPGIRSVSVLKAGAGQDVVIHAPGVVGQSYVAISISSAPFSFPGVVNLGIGGGSTVALFGPISHDAQSGIARFGPYPTASNLTGLRLYFQTACWDAIRPVLPLRVSNIWTTRYN